MRGIKFRCIHKNVDQSPDNIKMEDHKEACRILYNNACDVMSTLHLYYVMQWTGLTDKNGKQIYEGDIIKRFCEITEGGYKKGDLMYIAPVVYANESCAFVARKGLDFIMSKDYDFEIIGNIYQNPELLKP